MTNVELEITRQRAEIEIETYKARMEINAQRPRFEMKRRLPRMQMQKRLPQMHMDRTQRLMALHVGPALLTNIQYFQNALQDGMDAIGRIAEDGTILMQIQNSGNTIADIGAQSAMGQEGELNTAMLPGAEILWEEGMLSIDWSPGVMDMQWDVSAWADIRVEPHHVEIRMKKYPEIKIQFKIKQPKREPKKIVDQYV